MTQPRTTIPGSPSTAMSSTGKSAGLAPTGQRGTETAALPAIHVATRPAIDNTPPTQTRYRMHLPQRAHPTTGRHPERSEGSFQGSDDRDQGSEALIIAAF